MANTLTNLIPDLYAAMDMVSRELVGFVPAVTLDANANRAALNQTVRSFVAPASSASDITPAVTPPDDGDQSIGNRTIQITKARRVPFRWSGEQNASLGPSPAAIRQAQIAQAMRTLVNEIEADLAGLHVNASRAYGTAGTTPFGTAGDYSDAANVRRILMDNGCAETGIQLVINTAAGATLRGKQVTAADTNATDMLRRGVLLDVHGMAIRESAQVKTAAIGSVSGTLASLVRAKGVTALTTTADYSSTLLAGDIITIAGDSNQYVIASVSASAITINAPGLMQATTTGTKAITVIATAARNMAFHKGAIILAQRLPALVDGRDMATDRTIVTDPVSGLTFEVAEYLQYRQVQYEVSCCWGAAVMKPEHLAILLG